MTELKMWIAVRTDIRLSLGKGMTQAGHGYGNLFELARAALPEKMAAYAGAASDGGLVDTGQAKITVAVKNEAALRRVHQEALAAGIPAILVEDEGRSEVEPGTPTVVAFGPALRDDLPKYLRGLQQLKDRSEVETRRDELLEPLATFLAGKVVGDASHLAGEVLDLLQARLRPAVKTDEAA